ncbi:MAG: NAD-dependent epimerase/dehydratase family protein [Opitutales bacterium]
MKSRGIPDPVLVTGGTGFIGSRVVRQLVDAGHAVRVIAREDSDRSALDGLVVDWATGDLLDMALIRKACTGCRSVIHLASPSSWNDLEGDHVGPAIVDGTKHMVEAAQSAGLKRMVYVSSAAAIGGSRDPKVFDESARPGPPGQGMAYSHAKYEAELVCEGAVVDGFPVVIVNPVETYGPGDTRLITAGTLVAFIRHKPTIVPFGGTCIAHVDDVATGIIAALDRGQAGERYILGGENMTHRELAQMTLKLSGSRRLAVALPRPVVTFLAFAARAFGIDTGHPRAVLEYASYYWFMDNGKARTELGVTFRDARATLEPVIAWLQAEGRI